MGILLSKIPKKPTNAREYSYKQEQTFAKEVGARATGGSGRFDTKGDSRLKGVARFDNKATQKASYSIKLQDLKKLEQQCFLTGEEAIFQVDFLSESCKVKGSYVIITKNHYMDLIESYKNDDEKLT